MAVTLNTTSRVSFGTFTDNARPGLTLLVTWRSGASLSDGERLLGCWGGGGSQVFLIQMLGTTAMGFVVSTEIPGVSTGFKGRQTGAVFTTNTLYRLAFRWNGSANSMDIWVNGAATSVSTWISDHAGTQAQNQSSTLDIGYESSSGTQSADGDRAEFALYREAITNADLLAYTKFGVVPPRLSRRPFIYAPLLHKGDMRNVYGLPWGTLTGGTSAPHPIMQGLTPVATQRKRYKAAGGGSIACAVTAAGSVAANLRGAGAFACAAAGAGSVTADLKGAGAMACAISGTSTVAAAANQSWTLSHSDDFTRADTANIDASTMSDGLGAWSKRSGASPIAISSNEAVGPGGGTTVYYDSAASVIDGQRSGLTVRTLDGPGPMVRVQSDGSGYLAYPRSSASFNVYRWNGTSLTSIASSSDSFAVGDVCMIEANGTAIKAFKNGVEIASVTDATYATGRPGVYADNASHFDNWNSYVPSVAASSIACSISGTGSATADLRGAGAMACVVAASGSVAANLRGAGALAMAASGSSSVAANLAGAGAMACAISGTSSVSATPTAPAGSISCAITGSVTVAAALAGAGALSMACAAVATVTATWSAIASIRATITASAAVSCSVGDFASLTVNGPPRLREGHGSSLHEGRASALREGRASRLHEWP